MSLVDGFRILKKSFSRNRKGWKKYSGTAKEISKNIIDDCWNGEFFQTSTGHFNQFWVRDFSHIAKSLCSLGYESEVRKTLEYSLKVYMKKGRVTSQIQPNSKAVITFGIATDTLPLYLHTFLITKNYDLIDKSFFEKQIKNFEKEIIAEDNFVRQDKYLGWMRDHYNTKSSCYSNSMLLMLKNDLDKLKIKHNIKLTKDKFMKEFWNGKYFFHDRRKENRIEGSANTYPFWCGIVKDKKIHKLAMSAIKNEGLDSPWPLKYENKRVVKDELWYLRNIMPNYEGDAIWMHLGICYLDICLKSDLKKYLNKYEKLIIKHKNFLEVYTSEGKPYKNLIYCTDEGMSWVAGWLAKV